MGQGQQDTLRITIPYLDIWVKYGTIFAVSAYPDVRRRSRLDSQIIKNIEEERVSCSYARPVRPTVLLNREGQ